MFLSGLAGRRPARLLSGGRELRVLLLLLSAVPVRGPSVATMLGEPRRSSRFAGTRASKRSAGSRRTFPPDPSSSTTTKCCRSCANEARARLGDRTAQANGARLGSLVLRAALAVQEGRGGRGPAAFIRPARDRGALGDGERRPARAAPEDVRLDLAARRRFASPRTCPRSRATRTCPKRARKVPASNPASRAALDETWPAAEVAARGPARRVARQLGRDLQQLRPKPHEERATFRIARRSTTTSRRTTTAGSGRGASGGLTGPTIRVYDLRKRVAGNPAVIEMSCRSPSVTVAIPNVLVAVFGVLRRVVRDALEESKMSRRDAVSSARENPSRVLVWNRSNELTDQSCPIYSPSPIRSSLAVSASRPGGGVTPVARSARARNEPTGAESCECRFRKLAPRSLQATEDASPVDPDSDLTRTS